jgi:hypothetical protein
MADFMRVLAALDAATGWTTLKDYRAKVAEVGVRLIEGNALARALYYLAGPSPGEQPVWEGTASELIPRLRQIAAAKGLAAREIPEDPRALGAQIQEFAPTLRKAGVDIRKLQRTKSKRGYALFKRSAAPHEPSTSPSSSFLEEEDHVTLSPAPV